MDCKTAHLLHEFAGPRTSELDGDEAAALERHLADCPECARLARTARAAVDRMAAAMRAVAVPPGLRERLLAGLDEPACAGGPSPLWRRGRWVAAAVVLCAVSVSLLWRMHLPNSLNVE